jgi:DNA-dependent RNA polymerase auxiliary subunit epsilon
MRLPWKSKQTVRFDTPIASPIRESTLSLQRERPPEFDKEYAEEDTINTFRRALEEADAQAVEYISSVNDFAPIREKVRKSSKKRRDITREGWAYHVSRWPLLVLVFTLITLEFLAYILVRQLVNVIELFSGWRGDIGRLRLKLRRSKSYADWKDTAIQLDERK